MVKRIVYIVLVALLAVSCTQEPEPAYQNTLKGNFDALWQIIDTRYCYFEEKNIDWPRIYTQYAPAVQQLAETDTLDNYTRQLRFFDLCASMLDSLHDGHVNLRTSFDYSRTTDWYDAYPTNFDAQILSDRYLKDDYRVAGSLIYTTIGAGRDIGYIRYSSFENTISDANIYYVFCAFADCRGLIIDVRSNGGGDLETAYQLASYFLPDGTTTVGYRRHKTGAGHADFSDYEAITIKASDDLRWRRPVAVLTNRRCYSATNSFANAMRYARQAVLVGDTTGGGGGLPQSYDLPNGWLLRLSTVAMYDADYKSIESGVAPDQRVNIGYPYYDGIIETATQYIYMKTKYTE